MGALDEAPGVRHGQTETLVPWGALLLVLGGFGTVAEAGPIIAHRLSLATGDQNGAVASSRPWARDPLSPPTPLATKGGLPGDAPVPLDALGYPPVLPAVSLGAEGEPGGGPFSRLARRFEPGMLDAVRRGLPAGGPGLVSDRTWLLAAAPSHTLHRSPLGLGERRRIPEPASLILLLTGVAGLVVRRRLLRARPSSPNLPSSRRLGGRAGFW